MGSQFAQAQSTVSGSSSSTIETLDISSVRLSLDSGVGLFVFIINCIKGVLLEIRCKGTDILWSAQVVLARICQSVYHLRNRENFSGVLRVKRGRRGRKVDGN